MKSLIEPKTKKHSSKIFNKSLVWEHYYRLESGLAKCKFCGCLVKTPRGTTGGLWRHGCVKRITSESEVWKHYDRLEPGSAECKVCGETIKTTDSNTKGLWSHDCVKKLLRNRNIYSKKVTETESEPYFM